MSRLRVSVHPLVGGSRTVDELDLAYIQKDVLCT